MNKNIITHSPEETKAAARVLAQSLRPGSVLALHGDLGAGKTCFVQGLAEALSIHRPVNSPTYTLISEYRGSLPLFHIDLYRIKGEGDALSLGLDEYLDGQGVTAIEWAERVLPMLPPTTIHIYMKPGQRDDERVITIEGGP